MKVFFVFFCFFKFCSLEVKGKAPGIGEHSTRVINENETITRKSVIVFYVEIISALRFMYEARSHKVRRETEWQSWKTKGSEQKGFVQSVCQLFSLNCDCTSSSIDFYVFRIKSN